MNLYETLRGLMPPQAEIGPPREISLKNGEAYKIPRNNIPLNSAPKDMGRFGNR